MRMQTITMLKEEHVSEHGYRVIYEPVAEGGFQVIVTAKVSIVAQNLRWIHNSLLS